MKLVIRIDTDRVKDTTELADYLSYLSTAVRERAGMAGRDDEPMLNQDWSYCLNNVLRASFEEEK